MSTQRNEPALTHCQICGRAIKSTSGLIAHHGYQRPESGWQTSSCEGARHLPYEQDRERIVAVQRRVLEHSVSLVLQIDDVKANPPDELMTRVKKGTREYDACLQARLRQLAATIKRNEEFVRYLQSRYDSWTPPEEFSVEDIL